jgi:predicted transcriptional regulator
MNLHSTEVSPKRRDKLVIMAEIMNVSRNGALKTQIMYKANLSFAQLNSYLKFLARTNMLEKNSGQGKEIYKATQKGLDFMEKQHGIMDLLCDEHEGRNGVKMPPENMLAKTWL